MTRIKICGITNFEDARFAVQAGAHALGFVFAESPRRISPPVARQIIRRLPPFVATVGVFVNERPDMVAEIFHDCRLSAVQLHGEEELEYLNTLGLPLIKAFRVRDRAVLAQIQEYGLLYFLLDAYDPAAAGGTGKKFDWDIAHKAAEYGQVILSGGLDHKNVREALQNARPFAVDVSSGIEEQPGRKDHEKLGKFIREVHHWDSQTNQATSGITAAALYPKR
jgi:phosphoribosylanthranilate isomerase